MTAAELSKERNGAAVQLVCTDPPYNVKVEPRSNNAFVAGETSFHPVSQPKEKSRGKKPAKKPQAAKPAARKAAKK